jgi:hypothetical protein
MSDDPREDSNADGVDRSQIERMMALSPLERVRLVEDWVNGIVELRALQQRETDLGKVR